MMMKNHSTNYITVDYDDSSDDKLRASSASKPIFGVSYGHGLLTLEQSSSSLSSVQSSDGVDVTSLTSSIGLASNNSPSLLGCADVEPEL